jgi:hypothetical protein
MWYNKSGGGSEHAINSPTEIVPHQFKKDLRQMARNHYYGKEVPSAFSSWSASPHLVLCFARGKSPDEEPHIAVMDTENLDDDIDVLVWRCPDLDKGFCVHEYLAYGKIRGEGYRAFSLEYLKTQGLYEFLPVYLALLCLNPRPWFTATEPWYTSTDYDICEDKEIIKRLTGVLEKNEVTSKLEQLEVIKWLEVSVVRTRDSQFDFPDARQWIGLLSAIVEAMN